MFFFQLLKRGAGGAFFHIFQIAPIKQKKIVFINYCGKGYGDSGKAVTEELLRQKEKMDIVWAVKPAYKNSLPADVRYVRYNSLRYLYDMATAHIWVDNARKARTFTKRRGQYYIQLWHGGHLLKRIEKDAEQALGALYISDAKHDSQMADLIVSGSKFFSHIIRRAFWYNGEILECGTPKLDCLFHPLKNLNENIRDSFGISHECKIALYVPTFRSNYKLDAYTMDYERILEQLEQRTGSKWCLLVRLHPNISNRAGLVEYSDRVLNATFYPDLYELLPASDIVISDYSSVMFEAAMIGKPVFLYAADIDEYEKDRGFYFSLDELPFPLARSNDEMIDMLKSFNYNDYKAKLDVFFDKLQPFETGKAAETVAQRILEVISNRDASK